MSLITLGMINDRNYQDISVKNFVLPVKYSIYLIYKESKQNMFASLDVREKFVEISGFKTPLAIIVAVLDLIIKDSSLSKLDNYYVIVDINKFNDDMYRSIKKCEKAIDTFIEAYIAYKSYQFFKIISKDVAIEEIESFFFYLKKEYGLLDTISDNNDLIVDKSSDVAKFVLKIENSQTAEDKNILNLFYQYANAIASSTILMIYSGTEKSNNKVFKDIRFYLDTKIILNILGLCGDEEKIASDEYLKILKELGANLIILDITKIEVLGVLTASINSLNYNSDSIISNSFIHSLRKNINDFQIKNLILEKKDYISKDKLQQYRPPISLNKASATNENNDNYSGVINEDELYSFIESEYKEKHALKEGKSSRSPDVVHDIKCLQTVYKDRCGNSVFGYTEGCSFFITDNVPLCNAIDKWLKKEDERDQLSLTKEYRTFIFEAWAYSNKSIESISRITSLAVAKSIVNFSDEHMASVLRYVKNLANKDSKQEQDYQDIFMLSHIDRLSMPRIGEYTDSIEDKYKELALEANKILSQNPTLKEELERKSKEVANLATENSILKNENPSLKEKIEDKDKELASLKTEVERLKENETKRIEQARKNWQLVYIVIISIIIGAVIFLFVWYFKKLDIAFNVIGSVLTSVVSGIILNYINNSKK